MTKPVLKKILRYPNRTVLLSVGSLFPQDWEYVLIKKVVEIPDLIELTFQRIIIEKGEKPKHANVSKRICKRPP